MKDTTDLVARVLLGLIFVMAGFSKIGGYDGTAGYMDSMGVPGSLLPLVILLEVVGGLMVITGFKTKWAGYALAVFTLAAAFLFHFNFADQMQSILFMKNLAITGGLLLLAVHGTGRWSLDSKFSK